MGQLVIFLVFAAALLYLAAERQEAAMLVWLVAGLFGVLVAMLAPRKKLLLGLVPPLGGFLFSLYMAYQEGMTDLTAALNEWAPIALAALVGAFVGTRVRLVGGTQRPLRRHPWSGKRTKRR